MQDPARTPEQILKWAEEQGADLAALRANLALSPAERLAELVAMNRFHAEVQSRTLDDAAQRALREMELADARRRLAGLDH